MNPEDEIAQIKESVRDLIGSVQSIFATGEDIDDAFAAQIADLLDAAANRLEQLMAPPVDESARLLWVLAGGDESAFVNYLRTFPSEGMNALLTNPTMLNETIDRLKKEIPQGQPEAKDGVPHAPLQSSNVYGFTYDPNTKKLRVRFQEGGIYDYSNVPNGIFQLFASGAVPAKTDGENQYGRWWRGKVPSLGASLNQLLKIGGYDYQRVA